MAKKRRESREPVTLDIQSLTHEGKGIAEIDGKKIFVAGALPGERVSAQIVKSRRSYSEAITLSVEVASAERIPAKCDAFGICGGCSLQHLGHTAQVEHKQSVLLENLRRIGKLDIDTLAEPILSPSWSYRRKARLGVKYVHKKERVLVGFRERLKPYIADMQRCEVLSSALESLPETLAEFIGGLSISAQLPQVELAVADNAVALVFRVLQTPSVQDIELFAGFQRDTGYRVYLQPGGLNSVVTLDDYRDSGAAVSEALHYSVNSLKFEFLPTDFVQVNAAVNADLIDRALHWLDIGPQDKVLDLFCGIGNFSLPIAAKAAHVVGVEGAAELVERAHSNARLNKLSNTEFHVADLSKLDGKEPWLHQPYDKILLDPARAGALEMMPLVAKIRPQRVVYVSCHPATLARDLDALVHEHGFRLIHAGIADMFPHTAHVESIAVLEAA